MELIFGTRNYASRLSKSADIETNDPVQPTVRIMFTATVLPKPDSTAPCRFKPEIVEFTKDGPKNQSVVFSNHSDSTINVKLLSAIPRMLDFKSKPFTLKPTEIKKLDFKWKGTFAENDSNLSLTYEVSGDSIRHFTIPVLIKGTKPPEATPTPKEKIKQPGPVVKQSEPVKKETAPTPSGNKWPITLPDSTFSGQGGKK